MALQPERVTVHSRDSARAYGVRFFHVKCASCGVIATGFSTRAAADAHAETHRASHRALKGA